METFVFNTGRRKEIDHYSIGEFKPDIEFGELP